MDEEYGPYQNRSESSESESDSLNESYGQWFHKPEISCECGFKAKGCPNTGLRNHRHFPPFCLLSSENDIDYSYLIEDGWTAWHKRNWWLIGEIVEWITFHRLILEIKTRFGESVAVWYYGNAEEMKFYSIDKIQKGNTFCILNPFIHDFMDMS